MSAENHGSVSRGLRRLLRTIRGKGKGNKISRATLGTLAVLLPELRRRILMAAFGGRTLHLDMQFTHPPRADVFDHCKEEFRYDMQAHCLGAWPLSSLYGPDRDAPRT
ncbi:hypothetical protein BT67DRAFT_436865 [Trichocladium antarcticum]|uniref:Uncharacterized protein n=1 Tax=Trichocladium antarcticum TaxID=1450529 RepID=A0AAN6UDH5_9PEZI|nr:hypothetical protein BT67DRAFT_436865 [Trichocladium antarcticum]